MLRLFTFSPSLKRYLLDADKYKQLVIEHCFFAFMGAFYIQNILEKHTFHHQTTCLALITEYWKTLTQNIDTYLLNAT